MLADTPDIPVPLELARTLIVKGRLERRGMHKRQAGTSLRPAVELCEHIGATSWAQRAHGELARLGGKRRDAPASGEATCLQLILIPDDEIVLGSSTLALPPP